MIKQDYIENVVADMKRYLAMIKKPVYENPGWFNDEDKKLIAEEGFNIKVTSFYDGKILDVSTENIWTHSVKSQCLHEMGLFEEDVGDLSSYQFFFSVVEDNKQWNTDLVYEILGRDDEEGEEWVISLNERNLITKEEIELLSDCSNIPKEITDIFHRMKEYIKENNPDLRIRLFQTILL